MKKNCALRLRRGFGSGSVVKNPPAIQETRVPSLGQKDPLEEEMATHASVLAWRIPMDRGAWWAILHRVAKRWWLRWPK